MNSEARFARSRIRALMPALEAAGLAPSRIADAAAHLARARDALELATEAVLARAARPQDGRLLLDAAALVAAPREVGLRALAALLMAVSGEAYRPRFEALERLFDSIGSGALGRGATLHGCRLFPAPRGAAGFWSQNADFGAGKFQEPAESPVNRAARPGLRKAAETLNVLLAGNALETSYLINCAGTLAHMRGDGFGCLTPGQTLS